MEGMFRKSVEKMEQLNESMKGGLNAVQESMSGGLNAVKENLNITRGRQTLGEVLGGTMTDVKEYLGEKFMAGQELLAGTFNGAIDGLMGVFGGQSIFDLFTSSLMFFAETGLTKGVLGSLKSFATGTLLPFLLGFMAPFAALGALTELLDWFTGGAVGDVISDRLADNPVFTAIRDFVAGIPLIGDLLVPVVDGIGLIAVGIQDMANMIVSSIKSLLFSPLDSAVNILNFIWNATTAIPRLMTAGFERVLSFFGFNQLASGIGAIRQGVANLPLNLWNYIKQLGSIIEKKITAGLKGLGDFLGITEMVNRMVNTITTFPQNIMDHIKAWWNETTVEEQAKKRESEKAREILNQEVKGETAKEKGQERFRLAKEAGVRPEVLADVGGIETSAVKQKYSQIGGADNKMARGGLIEEPIVGRGMETGESYSFGEGGMKEAVVPMEDSSPEVSVQTPSPDNPRQEIRETVDVPMPDNGEELSNQTSLLQDIRDALNELSNPSGSQGTPLNQVPSTPSGGLRSYAEGAV